MAPTDKTGPGPETAYWSRPGELEAELNMAYPGPPATTAPAPEWTVPETEPVAPPRALPVLDDAALDQAESDATRLTYRVGLAALLVLLMIGLLKVL
jgi:hypothetical protein